MSLPMHLNQSLTPMDANKRVALTGRRAKAKIRTLYSCINCRRRKVKCDRVQPCYACCLRGIPDECTYVASGDKRNYMSQADAIATLRNEVKMLKKKVAEYEQGPRTCDSRADATGLDNNVSPGGSPSDPRYLALEAIAGALATTCPAACEEIVDQIRNGTDLAIVATSALAELTPPASLVSNNYPWNGSNGKAMVGGAMLLDGGLEPPSPGLRHSSPPPSDWMSLAESDAMENEFILDLSIPGLPRHWESYSPFFIDKFINDFAPPNPWRHRSTTSPLDTSWLRTLAHNISSFPFSKCSLRCVATAYCGKITGVPEISLSAQNMYAASLRILQCSLAAGAESSTDSICNALTLWLFELINSSCPAGWMNHLHGVQKLFERRGPQNAIAGIEHRAFLFIRFHGITDAITRRRPNFLSSNEWKTLPWSLNPSGKSPLHRLLDQAADIPGLLLAYDDIAERFNRCRLSPEEKESLCSCLLSRLDRLIDSLRLWMTQYDKQPSSYVVEMPVVDRGKKTAQNWSDHHRFGFPSPPFPGNRHDGTQPETAVYYSDGIVAQCLNLYYACIIVLCRLRAELLPMSTTSDIYDLACRICRSVEYQLFYTPPGPGALWTVFPLSQAYQAFSEGSPERAWIDGLLTWMDEKSPFIISRLVRPELDTAVLY